MFACFDEATRQAPVIDKGLKFAFHQYQASICCDQCGCNWFGIIPVNKVASGFKTSQSVFSANVNKFKGFCALRAAFQVETVWMFERQ